MKSYISVILSFVMAVIFLVLGAKMNWLVCGIMCGLFTIIGVFLDWIITKENQKKYDRMVKRQINLEKQFRQLSCMGKDVEDCINEVADCVTRVDEMGKNKQNIKGQVIIKGSQNTYEDWLARHEGEKLK